MNAHPRARRSTAAGLLGAATALLVLPSPVADADGGTWTAQITATGDLVISGSPALDTERVWAPGDISRTSLTVQNDFDRAVTVSLAARVDGSDAVQEALVITAGDHSALAPGGVEFAAVPIGGTTQVPVSVQLPLDSGNASQNQSASIVFTVHAVETTGQGGEPGGSADPSIPPTQLDPVAPTSRGTDRDTGATPRPEGGSAHQPGPSALARTGAGMGPWWLLAAAGLISLGAITMRAAARSRREKSS